MSSWTVTPTALSQPADSIGVRRPISVRTGPPCHGRRKAETEAGARKGRGGLARRSAVLRACASPARPRPSRAFAFACVTSRQPGRGGAGLASDRATRNTGGVTRLGNRARAWEAGTEWHRVASGRLEGRPPAAVRRSSALHTAYPLGALYALPALGPRRSAVERKPREAAVATTCTLGTTPSPWQRGTV